MKSVIKSLLLAALMLGVVAPASGDVSPLINYQGYLELDGVPVADATPTNYRVEFYVYDAPTGGNVIWGEAQTVTVFRGVFNTLLGAGDPIALNGEGAPAPAKPPLVDVFSSDQRWLTFVVPALSLNELSVRQQVASSPQALVAQRVVESSINSSNVADRSLGGIDLAVGTVGSTELLDGNVLSADIGNFSILAEDIAENAVDARILGGDAVLTGHIRDGEVTSADIADRTITYADIAVNSIGGAELIDQTVTAGKMGTGSVDSRVIADGTVGFNDFAEKLGAGEFVVCTRAGRGDDAFGGPQMWHGPNVWHELISASGGGIITSINIRTDDAYQDRSIAQFNEVPRRDSGVYIRIDGVHVYGPFADWRLEYGYATTLNGGSIPVVDGFHTNVSNDILVSPFLKFANKVEVKSATEGSFHLAVQMTVLRIP